MKRSYLFNRIFISKISKRNKNNLNQIVFKVSSCMTKQEIKHILEQLYRFKIKSINTILVEGKRKRSKHYFYKTARFKKAIITLESTELDASI